MAENGLLLGGRLRIAVHRRIGLLFQLLRFVFGAVLDGFGLRLGLLGQIVSAVDGVVFDGLGLIHQLLALFAGVILIAAALALASLVMASACLAASSLIAEALSFSWSACVAASF